MNHITLKSINAQHMWTLDSHQMLFLFLLKTEYVFKN